MNKIESFKVNHLLLKTGLYVSRKDKKNDTVVTTFDLRMKEPNNEPVMNTAELHTIEHLCATFLRNSDRKEDIIYFGPMGCRTGCYLVMFGDLKSIDVYDLVIDMCDYCLYFSGDIPGASAIECGNYLDQNLEMAKYHIKRYKDDLVKYRRFEYSE